MEEFSRIVYASGADCVICDVQLPEEYNGLCDYLENWGFIFTLMDLQMVNTTLGIVKERCAPTSKIATDSIRELSTADRKAFHLFCSQARNLSGKEQEITDLDENPDSYDQEISCYLQKEQTIDAALLVHRDALGILEIQLLKSLSGNPTDLLELIAYGSTKACLHYPEDTIVRYQCRTQASCSLTKRFFPEARPPVIRRGYWSRENSLLEEG